MSAVCAAGHQYPAAWTFLRRVEGVWMACFVCRHCVAVLMRPATPEEIATCPPKP